MRKKERKKCKGVINRERKMRGVGMGPVQLHLPSPEH